MTEGSALARAAWDEIALLLLGSAAPPPSPQPRSPPSPQLPLCADAAAAWPPAQSPPHGSGYSGTRAGRGNPVSPARVEGGAVGDGPHDPPAPLYWHADYGNERAARLVV